MQSSLVREHTNFIKSRCIYSPIYTLILIDSAAYICKTPSNRVGLLYYTPNSSSIQHVLCGVLQTANNKKTFASSCIFSAVTFFIQFKATHDGKNKEVRTIRIRKETCPFLTSCFSQLYSHVNKIDIYVVENKKCGIPI